MGRAPCCAKVGLKKGRWSAEEDAILINYIKQRGEAGAGSWRSLPRNAGLLRCGKSCRLRWINYLRSDLRRGNFTSHEQDTIIKLHAQLGNKWSMIANQLEGRTDNEIKNYWNSSLSRRATTCTTDTVPIISNSTSTTPPGSQNININSITPAAAAAALVLPQTTAAGVIDNAILVKKRRGRTSRAAMKKNKINTCVKSNKYHPVRAPLNEHTTPNSSDLSSSSSLSRTNSCTTYDNTVCLTSSAMTSTRTSDTEVGKKYQISQDADDALKLVLEPLLLGQNDSQIPMSQNINSLLDLDATNLLQEGVGLSSDGDVGMIADIYREYELAVEAEGRCDREIKTTMETSSVSLLASPKQAADDIQVALLSGEWDWINDVIVHPDIIDNQIWSADELDGSITWLWEYDQ